jgi:tetratricopeptide (TPR) repeat protein
VAEDELWRLACDAGLARAEVALVLGEPAEHVARGAEDAARRGVALVPRRASNLERVANALAMHARIAMRDGEPRAPALADAADSAYAAALELAPTNALVMSQRARSALLLGRPERALATAREISRLYPEAGTGHALQGAALLVLGRSADARAALRRASTARWDEDAPERAAVDNALRTLERSDSLPTASSRSGH